MSGADFTARAIALGGFARLASTESGDGGELVGLSGSDSRMVGRSLAEKLNDMVSVRDFGAVGDGVTDDTAAIREAIAAMTARSDLFFGFRMGTGMLFFPEGVYRITENGVLTELYHLQRSSLTLKGAGARNSILWLDPSALSAETWFYDNFDSRRQWGMVCEDLCFAGGTTWQEAAPLTGVGYGASNIDPKCNGFKLTGPGWESGFVFNRCEFRYLQMAFHTAGYNNADTHRFIACATNKCMNINYINNPQSVSVSWIGCYINEVYGNFLEFGPNSSGGGGNFLMQGGAIIAQVAAGDTSPHWVVRATAGGPGTSSAPVTFRDVRIELRGNYHGFAFASHAYTQVLAAGCSFHSTATANKLHTIVSQYCTIRFEGTSFSNGIDGGKFTYQIGEANDGRRGKNAHLSFSNGCIIDPAFNLVNANTIAWVGTGGRLTIDETCWPTDTSDLSGDTRVYSYATDTFGPTSISGEGQTVSTKHRTRKQFEVSPFWAQVNMAGAAGLTGTTVFIPPYSRIVGVWVKIEPGVGSTSNVRCLVGNDNKSVIYAATTLGPQNGGHYAFANVHVPTGTDNNLRKIRFWFDNGSGGNSAANASIRVDGGVIYMGQ